MSLLTDVEGFGTENLGGVHQLAGIGKVNNSAIFTALPGEESTSQPPKPPNRPSQKVDFNL
jgi:hypothetical protein